MRRRWVLLVTILAITGCQGSGSQGTATDPFFGRTRVEPPRTGAVSGRFPGGANPSQTAAPGTAGANVIGNQAVSQPIGGQSNPANPRGQSPPTQSNWNPSQPKVNPVPAAIPPQTSSIYGPPGGFSFPSEGGTTNAASSPLAGQGDRLSIPVAARTAGVSSSALGGARDDMASGAKATNPMSAGGGGPAEVVGGLPSSIATSGSGQAGMSPYLDPASSATLAGRERIVRDLDRPESAPNAAPRYAPYPSGIGATPNSASQPAPASDKPVNIADLPAAQ
jgi:hypothetical protein